MIPGLAALLSYRSARLNASTCDSQVSKAEKEIKSEITKVLRSSKTHRKYALRYTICHAPSPTSIPIVPKANHFTRSFVLSLVSLSFCSLPRRYSISNTISLTVSSIRRSSVSTGFSFSAAAMPDQSFASAPISMSSSTCREGLDLESWTRQQVPCHSKDTHSLSLRGCSRSRHQKLCLLDS